MPMGLACAPRVFSKLMKVVYSFLRQQGHIASGYFDDSYIQGDSVHSCKLSVDCTWDLFIELGFVPHEVKSITDPTQCLEHLGFVLDSTDMTVSISQSKRLKLTKAASKIKNSSSVSIRDVAQLIGFMVSNFPAVENGQLHYRSLEAEKTQALKTNAGNFDAVMCVSDVAKDDIQWWLGNVPNAKRKISHGPITHTLRTDASLEGWGAVLEGTATGGRWTLLEKALHINCLELKAALYGLQSLCSQMHNAHVHVLLDMDNTTAVAYVQHQGGSHSLRCNDIAREIWKYCVHVDRDIWLTATHIPGILNVEAHKKSRLFNDQTEWSLDLNMFQAITEMFGTPSIDMFASRLNCKVQSFVAWRPDPQAAATDAFTLQWNYDLLYCFPPFSVVHRVLQKLMTDQARVIVIVPLWPTQSWFSKLAWMLVDYPV